MVSIFWEKRTFWKRTCGRRIYCVLPFYWTKRGNLGVFEKVMKIEFNRITSRLSVVFHAKSIDSCRVKATLNRDISRLLATYFDTNTVEEPTWWVDHYKLAVSFRMFQQWYDFRSKIHFFFFKLGPWRCEMESRRLWETCQVTQSGHLNLRGIKEFTAYSRCPSIVRLDSGP